jgi:hypothetical protein
MLHYRYFGYSSHNSGRGLPVEKNIISATSAMLNTFSQWRRRVMGPD